MDTSITRSVNRVTAILTERIACLVTNSQGNVTASLPSRVSPVTGADQTITTTPSVKSVAVIRLALRACLAIHWAAVVLTAMDSCVNARIALPDEFATLANRITGIYK